MSVSNNTPFPALAFRQYTLGGRLNGVVVATGEFQLFADGSLELVDPQPGVRTADRYDGDPLSSDLVAPTDLAPFRPGTDVTLLGAAYTPDGQPLPDWTCCLRVGTLSKTLRVHGPREWQRRPTRSGFFRRRRDTPPDWDLGPASPVAHVVLSWTGAVGGRRWIDDAKADCHPSNPIGRGLIPLDIPEDRETWTAPVIEAADDPVQDPYSLPEPDNLAPVAPFWHPRQRHAGTYDNSWLSTRHPLLPVDFDYRFWQAAPPGLISPVWLCGGEPFELHNLIRRYPLMRGRLPRVEMGVSLRRRNGLRLARMVLDGVQFDLRPGRGRIRLSWRTAFPWTDGKGLPELHLRQPLRVTTA